MHNGIFWRSIPLDDLLKFWIADKKQWSLDDMGFIVQWCNIAPKVCTIITSFHKKWFFLTFKPYFSLDTLLKVIRIYKNKKYIFQHFESNYNFHFKNVPKIYLVSKTMHFFFFFNVIIETRSQSQLKHFAY